jgi:hypothetical protein
MVVTIKLRHWHTVTRPYASDEQMPGAGLSNYGDQEKQRFFV